MTIALYQVENGWIETYTGKQFHILDPKPDEICVQDIAHALAHQCRYNGHTIRHYSVAEHSVLLARYVFKMTSGKRLTRSMLLHDAAETYIGDMPRPLKHLVPQFIEIEKSIEQVIAKVFDVFLEMPEYLKDLDTRILVDERKQCMGKTDNKWGSDTLLPLGITICNWSPEEAEKQFLDMFYAIS